MVLYCANYSMIHLKGLKVNDEIDSCLWESRPDLIFNKGNFQVLRDTIFAW